MLNEFKKFIFKGNVVDLAVGVIIGASFGKIVDSIVKDIITPIIGLLGGQPDFSDWRLFGKMGEKLNDKGEAILDKAGKTIMEMQGGIAIGNFINALIGFLIIAAVVFFVIVKPMNKMLSLMKAKEAAAPAAPPEPTTSEKLLAEIRDSLKK